MRDSRPDTSLPSRRALLAAALTAGAVPLVAHAQGQNRAFADGALAGNDLARYFRRMPDGVSWPPSDFLSSGGRRPLSFYRGKTLLVSLWAETCAPCLVEMPIFAQLNAKYANARFEIVPIITGSKRLNTMARAQKFLNDSKIALATLMDGGKGGDELLRGLTASRGAPNGSLPCNLLIDGSGRIRGRQSGFVWLLPAGAAPPADAQAAFKEGKSIWEGPGSAEFFESLRQGALSA